MLPITRRAKRSLDSEHGAFDIPTIVASVAVAAIVTVGGAFSALALIPWQQDNAASDRLSEVQVAQANRLASGKDYVGLAQLGVSSINPDPSNPTVSTMTGNRSGCYTAVSRSNSGAVFMYESEMPTNDPLELAPDTNARCVGEANLRSMLGDIGVPDEQISQRTGAAKLDSPKSIDVVLEEQPSVNGKEQPPRTKVQWDAVEGASKYTIERKVADGQWDTVTSQTGTTHYFESAKGEVATFRISATDEAGSDSWPAEISYTTPAGDLENGDFENGLTGWTTGCMVESDGARKFMPGDGCSPGVVTPTGSNDSLGALQIRVGEAVRSTPFELSTETKAKLVMTARLAGAAGWTLEYLDADNNPVPGTAFRQEMIPKGEIGKWTGYASGGDLPTVPYPAVNARLILEGSGSSVGTAAQFDDILIVKR